MKKATMFVGMFLLISGAALADVLVTVTGEHIVTQGPWKVKGAVVVFTSEHGILQSMRKREIDLEASEAATAEAANAKPKQRKTYAPEPPKLPIPTEPPPEAVMTITNKDVGVSKSIFASSEVMDLSGLDAESADRILREIAHYSAALLRLHAQHDLTTGRGVRNATGALQGLASRARNQAETAPPELAYYYQSMANEMEGLAEAARKGPDGTAAQFATQFTGIDREAAERGARYLQTSEGRRQLAKEFNAGGR